MLVGLMCAALAKSERFWTGGIIAAPASSLLSLEARATGTIDVQHRWKALRRGTPGWDGWMIGFP
jgi:hypothetical protein